MSNEISITLSFPITLPTHLKTYLKFESGVFLPEVLLDCLKVAYCL